MNVKIIGSVVAKPNVINFSLWTRFSHNVSYIQGQSPEKNIREYFYYIDHQGMLFLDDSKMKNFTSCFKEKKFLAFFFRRLKVNKTERYQDSFPYISLCGVERNFVRCDDRPIVYTHIIDSDDGQLFCYNHAGDTLRNKFHPDKIFMSPETGRVYHPCQETAGSVGLVRSKLAIELSRYFIFDEGEEKPPTRFTWQGKTFDLDLEWMAASEVVASRNVN